MRIFQTVLGMIVVNSFLAFVFFSENESKPTLKEFVNALAVALSTLYVWKAICHCFAMQKETL